MTVVIDFILVVLIAIGIPTAFILFKIKQDEEIAKEMEVRKQIISRMPHTFVTLSKKIYRITYNSDGDILDIRRN